MPDTNTTYYRIAERTIANLKEQCRKGVYSSNLFRNAIRGLNKFYPLDKIDWMKDFLMDKNQNIASGCLECLCSHGASIREFVTVLSSRIDDRMFSLKAIDIAEKQKDPDTLLIYAEEDKPYLNRIIIAMKNTHNESYLTTLMLSDNQKLVSSIYRITKNS